MATRGEYTSIHTAMADDPEFQGLSADARLCVYTLKMILGASGIEVVRCFTAQMQQLTGLPEVRLLPALNELLSSKWVVVQGDVVWLRNGLKFNPNFTLENSKHKTSVERHLRGLPRCEVVNAFASYYGIGIPHAGIPIEWVSVPYGIQVAVEGSRNGSVLSEQAQAPQLEDNPEGEFCSLIRKHFWLGKEPPALLRTKYPGWTMGREITIGKQWAKDYGGWSNVLGMMPLFRKVLDIDGDQPLSCVFFNAKDARHKINQVLGHYQRLQEQAQSKKALQFGGLLNAS